MDTHFHNRRANGHGHGHGRKRNPQEVATKTVFSNPAPRPTGRPRAFRPSTVGGPMLGVPIARTESFPPTTTPVRLRTKAREDETAKARPTKSTTSTRPRSTKSTKSTKSSSSIDDDEDRRPTTKATSRPSSSRESSATSALDLLPTVASSTALEFSSPSSSIASLASTSNSTSGGGLSPGVTAGLAGAGIAILIALGAVAIFFIRRKAQVKHQQAYGNISDEKPAPSGAGAAGGASTAAAAAPVAEFDDKPAPSPVTERAPRVSLRTVSQFMPNLNGAPNAGATAPVTGAATLGVAGAVIAPKPHMVRTLSRKEPPPALVFNNPNDAALQGGNTGPLVPSVGHSSPTPSTFTDASAAASPFAGAAPADTATAGAVAAGAVNTAPVHRVQMDFVPSMGDELGLRGGQLVRVIHEYDDGWALCVRLDRSQQGVCPRTCLSQRPVKPRPQGSPPGYAGSTRLQNPPIAVAQPQSPHGFPSPAQSSPPQNYPTPGSPVVTGSPVATGRQSPRHSPPQSPSGGGVRPISPNVRPQTPQSPGGYYKPQYRPATSRPATPQSPGTQIVPGTPTTPTITVSSTTDDEPTPASPTRSQSPQSPTFTPRPATAPIRPSPLSNQTSSGNEGKIAQKAPDFHAM